MGFNTKQLLVFALAVAIVFNFSYVGFANDDLQRARNDSEMDEFYKSFDSNKNNELEWDEASQFYSWVKKNVKYRYDDENTVNPIRKSIVGDGRVGDDFQQSPLETYNERAGDCEDQNGMQVDFFRYWGREAKLGVIKLKENEYHAIALVKVNENDPTFSNSFYYNIDSVRSKYYGLSPGKYIVVDNTYGTRIGELKSSNTKLLYTRYIY